MRFVLDVLTSWKGSKQELPIEVEDLAGSQTRFTALKALAEGAVPAGDEVIDAIVGNVHAPI